MESTVALEVHGRRGLIRPTGIASLDQLSATVDDALRAARDLGLEQLFADLTQLAVLSNPNVVDRYQMVTRWANTASAVVALALVAPAALIDPGRIGVTMAANRGMRFQVFTSEADALSWLDSQK